MESGAPQPGRLLDRTNVAALIPAYEEEAHVRSVAERTRHELDHVLVIDDGSTDATAAHAREGGSEVIVHPQNRGKGEAIKTGLRHWYARPAIEFILILDADGQHLPEEIGRFLAAATATHAGLFIGTRMNDLRAMPFVRRVVNRYMSRRISRICGQEIPDTQCGYRMIARRLVPHLLDSGPSDVDPAVAGRADPAVAGRADPAVAGGADPGRQSRNLAASHATTSRFDYETEMLFIASRAGFRIASVPISTIYSDEVSSIHPIRDTVRFFRLMWRYEKPYPS